MNLSTTSIKNLVMHQVGNFSLGEGVKFSEDLIPYKDIEQDLIKLITNSFSNKEIYHFAVEESISSNLVKDIIKYIFE